MLPDFELCCAEFEKYSLTLTEDKYQKLDKYAAFLVEYNKKVNLTAITSPEEILIKHFIDSLIVLNYIDIPTGASLIDVGTGAGFPSVPIKIFRDDIELTLLDSLSKRVNFLNELSNILSIHVKTVHGRAEDISKQDEYRENFDFSCARAVANLAVLSEYCLPFVKVGGKFIAMKGPNESVSIAENAVKILGGEISDIYDYSIQNEGRRIITIKKISQTPSKYPRNSSQIKKKSL